MLEEGLEISQPALDPHNSEVHHLLTARDNRTEVHRNINKTLRGGRKCDENNTDPSCTGFVEMMAPVNSRASWRCIRHIIQNDLVHAWVLGFQLGYCAETISPSCIPSLGGLAANKTIAEAHDQPAHNISLPSSEQLVSP